MSGLQLFECVGNTDIEKTQSRVIFKEFINGDNNLNPDD
jgi:hypothetical protein